MQCFMMVKPDIYEKIKCFQWWQIYDLSKSFDKYVGSVMDYLQPLVNAGKVEHV